MKTCEWCERRAELGWYGDAKIHHCRECHRTWTGTSQAHCVNCHHHFSSNSAADRHLVDDRCMPPQEVRDKNGIPRLGLRQDKYGYTWSFAGDGTPWWLAKHPADVSEMHEPVDVTDGGHTETPGAITPGASAAAL